MECFSGIETLYDVLPGQVNYLWNFGSPAKSTGHNYLKVIFNKTKSNNIIKLLSSLYVLCPLLSLNLRAFKKNKQITA